MHPLTDHTPDAATLERLARAWLEGVPGANYALHDALEESGWPVVWLGWNLAVAADLQIRDTGLTLAYWCQSWNPRTGARRYACRVVGGDEFFVASLPKAACLAALRAALLRG